MEILEGRVLADLLLEKYSKSPRGWSFVVAPSRTHGFFDAFVSNPEQSWQIKMDSIFKPIPLVLGTQTEAEQRRISSLSPVTFGFRKFDPKLALRLLGGSPEEDEPSSDGLSFDLSSILNSDPVVPREGGSYAQGPFVMAHQNLIKFSDAEKATDERLASELHKLFTRRYPNYR
jgi:hypothetical protein